MESFGEHLTDVEYAKKGLALWFNNKPEESEEFFKLRLDSTPIFAAYSFVVCMVRLRFYLLHSTFISIFLHYKKLSDFHFAISMKRLASKNS